jgi:glutamate 5-kinase
VTVPQAAPPAQRPDIATALRVVVKVGSSSLTTADGEIDGDRIAALAGALAARPARSRVNHRVGSGQAGGSGR